MLWDMGSNKAWSIGHEWAVVGRNGIFYKIVEGVSHNNQIFYDYLLDDGCIWVLQQNIPKNNIQQLIVQNVEQVHLEYKCSA